MQVTFDRAIGDATLHSRPRLPKRLPMFGLFSLPKILFTVLVVCAVWYGFKWLARRQSVVDSEARANFKRRTASESKSNDGDTIEDMVECPDCGAFVAKGSRHNCT